MISLLGPRQSEARSDLTWLQDLVTLNDRDGSIHTD